MPQVQADHRAALAHSLLDQRANRYRLAAGTVDHPGKFPPLQQRRKAGGGVLDGQVIAQLFAGGHVEHRIAGIDRPV